MLKLVNYIIDFYKTEHEFAVIAAPVFSEHSLITRFDVFLLTPKNNFLENTKEYIENKDALTPFFKSIADGNRYTELIEVLSAKDLEHTTESMLRSIMKHMKKHGYETDEEIANDGKDLLFEKTKEAVAFLFSDIFFNILYTYIENQGYEISMENENILLSIITEHEKFNDFCQRCF